MIKRECAHAQDNPDDFRNFSLNFRGYFLAMFDFQVPMLFKVCKTKDSTFPINRYERPKIQVYDFNKVVWIVHLVDMFFSSITLAKTHQNLHNIVRRGNPEIRKQIYML